METMLLEKLAEKYPEVLTVLLPLIKQLENVVHPPAIRTAEKDEDIEARLDSSYKEILKQNKKSETMRSLIRIVSDLLSHLAAKHGIQL